MIKAILYDLDGVLVDATEWHYESLNIALKEIAGFIIERSEHVSTFNGIPTKKKMEILNKQNRLPSTLFQDVWNMKQEKTKEVIEKYGSLDQNKIRLSPKKTEGFCNLGRYLIYQNNQSYFSKIHLKAMDNSKNSTYGIEYRKMKNKLEQIGWKMLISDLRNKIY